MTSRGEDVPQSLDEVFPELEFRNAIDVYRYGLDHEYIDVVGRAIAAGHDVNPVMRDRYERFMRWQQQLYQPDEPIRPDDGRPGHRIQRSSTLAAGILGWGWITPAKLPPPPPQPQIGEVEKTYWDAEGGIHSLSKWAATVPATETAADHLIAEAIYRIAEARLAPTWRASAVLCWGSYEAAGGRRVEVDIYADR